MMSCDDIRGRFFAEATPPHDAPSSRRISACRVPAGAAGAPGCRRRPGPVALRLRTAAAAVCPRRARRLPGRARVPSPRLHAPCGAFRRHRGDGSGRRARHGRHRRPPYTPGPRLVEAGGCSTTPRASRWASCRAARACARARRRPRRPRHLQRGTTVARARRRSLEVPHLGAGRTLSVDTPEAQVRVRGTRFHVSATSSARPCR